MKVVLIGYRGAGKTTIGRMLSSVLGYEYISTDEEIVKRVGMKIPEYVQKYGWEAFRDVESEVASEVSEKDDVVIDTGGGIVLREKNVHALRKNGVIIFLSAPPEVLAERIKDDTGRPPLKKGKTHWEEVKEVLEERMPYYRRAMDFEVTTNGKSPEEVVEEIMRLLRKK